MKATVSPVEFNIIKIASVSPKVEIANPLKNAEYILNELSKGVISDCQIVVCPELCLTGYTCADLFFQRPLIEDSYAALEYLCERLRDDGRLLAVGAPLMYDGKLYNCGIIIAGGKILGVVPKSNIPNYQEFYEKRWFYSGASIGDAEIRIGNELVPFGTNLIFKHCGTQIGIEICEDLWVPSPPSSRLCTEGAEIILNLSATDDNIGKYGYIRELVASQSGRCRCVYAYASAGRGESSTDLVFSGINVIACDGTIIGEGKRFSRDASFTTAVADIERLRNDRRKYSTFHSDSQKTGKYRFIESDCDTVVQNFDFHVDPYPFIPSDERSRIEHCTEIINIQSWGLAQRLEATDCKNLIIGISGGLDSTLALLIANHTFELLGYDKKGILGVTMPAEATSERTHSNAVQLMELLGVSTMEIPVNDAVKIHFRDISHDPLKYDSVYENSQARERTQILMDLSNKYSGMVLGTGDMSELALGWCTYNGDHMSMYNVNAGVPKTLVRHLVKWFADASENNILRKVLEDIIDTPISPELIPYGQERQIGQKTEEIIGPYELHDFFLFHMLRNGFTPYKIHYLSEKAFGLRYSAKELKKWLLVFYRRFFSQQFKRSCMPDGPKIGSVCLSPRGDWRMPSDASAALWIASTEEIPE